MESGRAAQLAHQWRDLDARVAAACRAAGRQRSEVTVIAVTKTRPASDVRILAGLGLRDFGENRAAEGSAKAHDCIDLAARWHMIGQIQTNKAGAVVGFADVVHSVDRPALIDALQRRCALAGRHLEVLVQVNIDPPGAGGSSAGRGGADPADLLGLCDQVAGAADLTLRGLMAVPHPQEPAAVAFERLSRLAAAVRSDFPGATWLSAGMSADLEHAVLAGATHLRVGTALLGDRPAVQ